MFKNAKPGDNVWDFRYGWGTIFKVKKDKTYCIETLNDSFDITGRSQKQHVRPLLFWDELLIETPAVPVPDLKVDTKVIVWNETSKNEDKRYFSHFYENVIYCFDHGLTSWNATGSSPWEYWELNKDEDVNKTKE